MAVQREGGVVDDVAGVAGEVRRRPDRAEDLEIGVRHEAERAAPLLGVSDRRARRGGHRGRTREEGATTQMAHRARPRMEAGAPGNATRLPVSVTVEPSTFRMDRSRVV